MFSYKQILQISNMFIETEDPYLTPCSIYDNIDLGEDLPWNYTLMNFPNSEFLMSGCDQFDFLAPCYDRPISPRSLIRHHDCMWSGRCTTHPDKFQCNYMKQKFDSHLKKLNSLDLTTANNTNTNTNNTQKKIEQESIPAGRSLLINSRFNQTQKPAVLKLPTVSTNDFLKDREFTVRPDTPLSLDDDPPVFKHSIDLAACTMGSNKMSLITDTDGPTEIINLLKEHLEDSTSTDCQIRNKLSAFMPSSNTDSLTDLIKDIKSLSDFEGFDDDSTEELDSDSESNNTTTIPSSQSSQQSRSSTINDFNQTLHSDHSYTRSKSRVDVVGLGVQTPSDSEEEIDVVSIGEKTLPTNPTERDRRQLQTTVAHKISARIVKTSAGIRTIPPRRRYYDESESSCSVTPTKSNHQQSSNYGSHHNDTQHQQQHNSRKRPHSNRDDSSNRNNNVKRHKGKKQRLARRRNSESDETDTIEKRNQHNDMERQRRIGLKNLFEELKRQLPGLKDKERAPKVSILREATNLCRRFNREEDEKEALKRRQAKLYNRVSVLRTSLAAQRSRYLD